METRNIYKAITSLMNEVEPIGKNKTNSAQNFNYRGIDDMYNELQPLFTKYKVFITSEVLESSREERTTKHGGALIYTIMKVRFTFYTEDGSNVSSVTQGEAMDSADKSSNKAMSVALKYCLMQLLLIPTEELKRDDPDGHTHDPLPKTNGLPAITAKNLESAKERILKGETDLYTKIKTTFTLTAWQDEQLSDAVQKVKQLQPA